MGTKKLLFGAVNMMDGFMPRPVRGAANRLGRTPPVQLATGLVSLFVPGMYYRRLVDSHGQQLLEAQRREVQMLGGLVLWAERAGTPIDPDATVEELFTTYCKENDITVTGAVKDKHQAEVLQQLFPEVSGPPVD